MKTDIQIAREAKLERINAIAERMGIPADDVYNYGPYMAKVPLTLIDEERCKRNHLILVTAITPTKAGNGKTTVSVGLAQALCQLGKNAVAALREPSLGPCFGMKGGAAGGGYSQVLPMENINLHFTGDFHAITSAHNMITALLDNYIYQNRNHGFGLRQILWKRVLDVNDRSLRNVVTGLGKTVDGVPSQSGFDITPASEIMAIMCLATDMHDLRRRIGKILLGYTFEDEPFTVDDLGVAGAITVLLKDALNPNLVQTLENTPAFVHGGPFANIAHGCNSVLATKTALQLADYTVTEAGFGADLGAEKFLDIKRPVLGKTPDALVIVATVRALEYNGGAALADLKDEQLPALKKGLANLNRHIKNMQRYGLPVVVAINHFTFDTEAEIKTIEDNCHELGVNVVLADAWAKGGEGTVDLAKEVVKLADQPSEFHELYSVEGDSIEDKVNTIAKTIYGAKDVEFSKKAQKQLKKFHEMGWENMPVCIAKTQYSFTDDQTELGAPTDFTFHIREFVPKLGAGFVVALSGSVMTMPGLGKKPAAVNMHIDGEGNITGLF